MTNEQQQVVELQRSVRYGRLLIGGAVVGGLIASLISVLNPLPEDSMYETRQMVGFMLLVGGAIGLGLGGILALALSRIARRGRGTGVVAVSTESSAAQNSNDAESAE